MTDRLHDTLNRWLRFEERNEQAAADTEFFRLFRLLPSPEPCANFVDRVMTRSGIGREVGYVYNRPLRIALRISLCLGLVLSALTAAVVPSVLLPLVRQLNPMKMFDLGIDMTVELLRRVAESVAVWRALASLGDSMSQLVESPVGVAALMMGFVLSAGALRAISALIAADQRGRYVSFV